MKVSQDKADALLAEMNERIPDLQIIYKDEPMPTWWLKGLALIISVVGFFNSGFLESWNTSISNGIGGRWVLLPSRESHGDFTRHNVYSALRHEFVHLLDQQKGPTWFYLTYLALPLPIFYTGRAHWECRGYAQNMIVSFEETGAISENLKTWIKSQFTNSLYLWMWWDADDVDERIDLIAQGILEGEYAGTYPDISW